MEWATFAIAVIGVVLAALSLGWQAAIYFLTGGRAKAHLMLDAMGPDGVVAGPVDRHSRRWVERIAEQGYIRPVIGITVVNHGRLPLTVNSWAIVAPVGVAYAPLAHGIGPGLPHRLEAGEQGARYTDFEWARRLAEVTADVASGDGTNSGRVVLATGKHVRVRGAIRVDLSAGL